MKREVLDLTTDEEIALALAEARNLPPEPLAISAVYNRVEDTITLRLDSGRRLVLPREEMQGLQDATPEQISDIQIFSGVDMCWPQLDLDHNLRSLLSHRYGSDQWMQSLERGWMQKLEQRTRAA